MTGARLGLAARFLWAARPLQVLVAAACLVTGAVYLVLGDEAAYVAALVALFTVAFVGSRLTVPRVVHRELVAQARSVSPPM